MTRLFIYPLKSGRRIELERAEVHSFGFRHDRRWMVVDGSGHFMTQRDQPRLALVAPRLGETDLVLSAPEMPPLRVPLSAGGNAEPRVRARIWDKEVQAAEVSGDASSWLTRFLGLEARLVFMPGETFRPVDPAYAIGDDRTAFTDGYPFLLASEDSLDDLNGRLASPVSIDRFRPNLVVRGGVPFAEDDWDRFEIDGVPFHAVKRCGRCVVTTIDQDTAEKGAEPLRTLAGYRSIDGQACFGVNLVHAGMGFIGRGSTVHLG